MIAPRVTITRLSARRQPAPAYEKVAPADGKTRETMIREAAYLVAERRGFMPGKELEDWLAAEREVDQLLAPRATQQR